MPAPTSPGHSNSGTALIADDHAVSASAGGGNVILLKERDGQLRQAHWDLKGSAGDIGCKFTGDERLLCAGSHAGRNDVTVIESEIGAGLALVISRIDVHDQINVLGAGNEDSHLGGIAKTND